MQTRDPTELRDRNPLCGQCYGTLTHRSTDGSWHCSHCADDGARLGVINVRNPLHPAFEDWMQQDPANLVGYHVERSEYTADSRTGDDPDSMGTIADYVAENDELRIRTDLDEPFDFTERVIDWDTFTEYLWTPMPRREQPPEQLHLIIHQP